MHNALRFLLNWPLGIYFYTTCTFNANKRWEIHICMDYYWSHCELKRRDMKNEMFRNIVCEMFLRNVRLAFQAANEHFKSVIVSDKLQMLTCVLWWKYLYFIIKCASALENIFQRTCFSRLCFMLVLCCFMSTSTFFVIRILFYLITLLCLLNFSFN